MTTDTTRAALAQALDALRLKYSDVIYDQSPELARRFESDIDAAQAALAAPQEPVRIVYRHGDPETGDQGELGTLDDAGNWHPFCTDAPAALAQAAPQETVAPAGWVLVPVEPTPEMLAEAQRQIGDWTTYWFGRMWAACVAAAPAAPARAEPTDTTDWKAIARVQSDKLSVALDEPLTGWKFNHARRHPDPDQGGAWEIGFLDDEDDRFSPIVTVDTGLYYQDEQAEPLARAILAKLAAPSAPAQQEPVTQDLAVMSDKEREAFQAGYEEAEADAKICDVPPPGWRCTRTAGHEGPCAAVEAPEDVDLVAKGMERLRELAPARAEPTALTHAQAVKLLDEWADACCMRFTNRSYTTITTEAVTRDDLIQLIHAANYALAQGGAA